MKLNNYLHRFDTIRKHFFAARQKQKRMLLLGQKQNRPSDKLLHWSLLSLDLKWLGCYLAAESFFAQSQHIKLASPQAAQLSIFFILENQQCCTSAP